MQLTTGHDGHDVKSVKSIAHLVRHLAQLPGNGQWPTAISTTAKGLGPDPNSNPNDPNISLV